MLFCWTLILLNISYYFWREPTGPTLQWKDKEGKRERERERDRQMKNNKSVDLTYTSDDDVKPTWHKTGVISDKKTRNNRNAVYSSKYEDEDSHTHLKF